MSTVRHLSPEDVFRFVHVAEVAIAPQAGRIAQVVVRRDRQHDTRIARLSLWADGSGWHDVPESDGASTLRWSPDGTRLAFLRRHAGTTALLVLNAASGAVQVLEGTAASLREIAWSPDGSRIAFQHFEASLPPDWLSLPVASDGAHWAPPVTVTERLVYRHDTIGLLHEGAWQTCIVPADGSARPSQVTEGPWFSGFNFPPGLGWSPDGLHLVLAGNQRADWDRDLSDIPIQSIEIATGAVTRLTFEPGAQSAPALSPDGRYLAYAAVTEPQISGQIRHLHLRELASGAVRKLPQTEALLVDSLAWAADSSALYLCGDRPGHRGITRAGLDGGVSELVADLGSFSIEMPYQGGGFSLAADGSLAYVRGAIDHPGDVVLRGPNGDTTVLTAHNTALIADIGGFRHAETFQIPAKRDGALIQSWLMLPRAPPPAKGWPVLLEIHGGPQAMWGPGEASMWHEFQFFASRGYGIVYCNPRGSGGYGYNFQYANYQNWGPGPGADVLAAVDLAAKEPWVDANREVVMGGSYGGYLTAWLITQDHRFKAAVAIRGVYDLATFFGEGNAWRLVPDDFGGYPWQKNIRPILEANSPMTFVDRITTPLLIKHGDTDFRTGYVQSEMLYKSLKVLGQPVEYARYPHATHELSRSGDPRQRLDRIVRFDEFFRRYIGEN